MKNDMKMVEDITRKSFYNIYIPGCVEHYLIHIMREHKDFIKELDFVLELNGKVIGNIMYTKAKLIDETGKEKKYFNLWSCLCFSCLSEKRIWKNAYGTFFYKSKRYGI